MILGEPCTEKTKVILILVHLNPLMMKEINFQSFSTFPSFKSYIWEDINYNKTLCLSSNFSQTLPSNCQPHRHSYKIWMHCALYIWRYWSL